MAASPIGGSGIDVNTIVGQLMQLEQRPLVKLANKEAGIQAKLSAIGTLKGALSSLQTAVQSLAKADSLNARSAAVVGDQVSATAGPSAVDSVYSVEVTTLARSQSLASKAFTDSATVVGGGTLTLQKGTYDSGTNTFTAAAGVAAVNITIDAGSSLATIRDKINAANAGVSAALVTDSTGTKLTLISTGTGAANSFKITTTDGDGTHTDSASGLSQLAFDPTAAVNSGKNLTETRSAIDSSVKVNGLTITSASNTLTGAIQGVTLTLKKEDPGKTAEVTVSRDKSFITNAINVFVKAYNELEKTLANSMSYDPNTRKAGILNGEVAARSVQSQLRNAMGAAQSGATTYTTLSSVGVTFEKNGTLKFDSTKFDAAMLADPARVANLFTQDTGVAATSGIAVQMEDVLTSVLGESGPIKARSDGLNANLKTLSKQQEAINRRLEATEKRLRREYTRLDGLLMSMQSTSNSLANSLAQLPGNSSG